MDLQAIASPLPATGRPGPLARLLRADAAENTPENTPVSAPETGADETACLERLFRRHRAGVHAFALRLTGRADLAEEVVSEVFLAVWRGAGAFRGEARVKSWIFGIAYRIAMRLGSRQARERHALEVDDTIPAAETGMDLYGRCARQRRIAKALARLPAPQRTAIELAYWGGFSLAEIAGIVDCPEGTVKTRLFHARERLRALLGDCREDIDIAA